MRYFGEPWGAAVCDTGEHVPTPVGWACYACSFPVFAGDQGLLLETWRDDHYELIPVHLDCLTRMVGVDAGAATG